MTPGRNVFTMCGKPCSYLPQQHSWIKQCSFCIQTYSGGKGVTSAIELLTATGGVLATENSDEGTGGSRDSMSPATELHHHLKLNKANTVIGG